jgi:hypothetical protein
MWIMIMLFVKIFEEEVNVVIKGPLERQPTNKRQCCKKCSIQKTFFVKDPFKRMMNYKKIFWKTLGLLIMKNQLPFVVCRKCLV